MPELVVMRQEDELARMLLGQNELSIGRDSDNDIVINNPTVSRRHARIIADGDGYIFEDCGSSNGSYLNKKRIAKHRLQDGDEIRISDHHLVYAATCGEAVSSPPQKEDRLLGQSFVGGVQRGQEGEVLRSILMDPNKDQEGAKRLQALFEISQVLEEGKDFKAVLVDLMDRAIRIMGADRGFLMLADSENAELRVHVARDLKGDIQGVERETISRSIMRQVMETRKPVLVCDALSGEWTTRSVIAHSIHSALCAPLITRDVVTGVIYVDDRKPFSMFSEQDLAFFTTFALQAKTAIDSSRSYWELVDSLFKASDDFIVVCSPEGRITQANRAAAAILGRTSESLVSEALEDWVVPQDRSKVVALCQDTLGQGVASGFELCLAPKERATVPLSVSSFALRDRAGRAIGLCLIGRDLSEIKGLIGKLEEANEQLSIHNSFIRKTFGRYLSEEIVANLLMSPEGLELGGQKRKVTILMSDLRGFTSAVERMSPETVVSILNQYLAVMVDIILRHEGTIDEFIGDAILVIFGAPILGEDDALRASACAVEMQLAMREINDWCRKTGVQELEMGIAINTGEVVVGNIGSHKRAKYGVVGRHVNLASRIESISVGGQILIAESTLKDAGDALEIGNRMELNMKGVKGTLTVYELLGVAGAHPLRLPEKRAELHTLGHALTVKFSVLEGKQIGEEMMPGRIVKLGPKEAHLATSTPLQALSNLKLLIESPDLGDTREDLYAKIMGPVADSADLYLMRFTSIPPDVIAYFAKLTDGSPT